MIRCGLKKFDTLIPNNVELFSRPPQKPASTSELALYGSRKRNWRTAVSFRKDASEIRNHPIPDIVTIDGRAMAACLREAHQIITKGGVIVLDNAMRVRSEEHTSELQSRRFYS
jgi:hypothetical protein